MLETQKMIEQVCDQLGVALGMMEEEGSMKK